MVYGSPYLKNDKHESAPAGAAHCCPGSETWFAPSLMLSMEKLCSEEIAMTFLIQFKRFRRGVPEVIGTLPIAAADGAAALAFARSLAGMRRWPSRTDALRVMDDGGRTLLDWTVPVATAQPVTSSPTPVPAKPAGKEPRPAPLMTAEHPEESPINAHPGPASVCCGTGRLLRGGWSARDLERRL